MNVLKADKLDASKKNLYATIGLPYSGKTTWAKSQYERPIVNPDSIRVAIHGHKFIKEAEDYVWAIARTMVKSLFLAGHNDVILDATNLQIKYREEWINPYKYSTHWVLIDTPIETCLERAYEAGDLEIIPIIKKMNASKELPPISTLTVKGYYVNP